MFNKLSQKRKVIIMRLSKGYAGICKNIWGKLVVLKAYNRYISSYAENH